MADLHDLSLAHYSAKPLLSVHSRETNGRKVGIGKPTGLWVSVDGKHDWPAWCRAEEFAIASLDCRTRVWLKHDVRVLHLAGATAIKLFTREYAQDHPYPLSRTIDWSRVGSKYQGIIIAPYCWDCRYSDDTFWYYSWDCASGCIWDADAIASLEPVEELESAHA